MVYLFILFIVILVLPGWWVKYILNKYSIEYPALPGTGGELAEHLIQRFQLPVTLEVTELGDHYDPDSKTVRLSEHFLNGKSLSAVAVAAHEVGHAIQDHQGYGLLALRTRLARVAMSAEKIGGIAFVLFPVLALISRSPTLGAGLLFIAMGSLLLSLVVHLSTLPVEWDASFNKALPILQQGEYLSAAELIIARKILLAAALTYVAGALLSIVNIWRWLRLLRLR